MRHGRARALCIRCTWQEYRYLIKELKQEYVLAAVLVDASCKRYLYMC